MNKRVFFWILSIILVSSNVYAQNPLGLSHTDFQNTILPEGTATFFLKINNNQDKVDIFRIEKPGVYWEWLLETEPNIRVLNRDSETIRIDLTPLSEQNPGDYGISLDVISTSNDSVKESELFEVKVVSYEQTLLYEILTTANINPNKENLFRIKIQNNYNIDIKNLTLRFNSGHFDESRGFNIRPYETLELQFPIEFEGTVETGDNSVFLEFFHNEKSVLFKEEIISIGQFTDVSGRGTPEKGFLYNRETITRTNEGNTVSQESYVKRLSFFQKFFTSTSPQPSEVNRDNGNYVLIWDFELSPDETRTITIETDYRYFTLAVIVIILLVIGLYYILKRDVSLEKRIVTMKKGDDGYYSLNVVLSLKNKTLKDIRNIKVMDRLGGRVEKAFNFGTLRPKVFRTNFGKSTKLVWNIPFLGKKEEIVLQYTMKYKPHIIKSVPSAIAKYLRKGRPKFVKSNRAELFR